MTLVNLVIQKNIKVEESTKPLDMSGLFMNRYPKKNQSIVGLFSHHLTKAMGHQRSGKRLSLKNVLHITSIIMVLGFSGVSMAKIQWMKFI